MHTVMRQECSSYDSGTIGSVAHQYFLCKQCFPCSYACGMTAESFVCKRARACVRACVRAGGLERAKNPYQDKQSGQIYVLLEIR